MAPITALLVAAVIAMSGNPNRGCNGFARFTFFYAGSSSRTTGRAATYFSTSGIIPILTRDHCV